jgi:aryl-alcohol dehydrogenase-like predicted oxidoreductase
MEQRPLPGTDLVVSALGFGCWAMGGVYWGDDVTDERSTAAVHAALDGGVTLFDTAPLYGEGHADEVLVRALGPRKRDVVIATKVGVRFGTDGGHARSDLRPEHVVQDAEASLRRLGLEAIDLLQVHWPCEDGTPLEDTVAALDRLKDRGDVRHWGLCNYGAEDLRRAAALGTPSTLQTPYNLLRREAERDLLPACRELGLGVLAYEPLCRGLLSGRFRTPPTFPDSDLRSRDDRFAGPLFLRSAPFVDGLKRAAARLSVPTAALAVAWVAHQPGVTCALVGMKGPEQVAENLLASRLLRAERIWPVVDRIADLWRG